MITLSNIGMAFSLFVVALLGVVTLVAFIRSQAVKREQKRTDSLFSRRKWRDLE